MRTSFEQCGGIEENFPSLKVGRNLLKHKSTCVINFHRYPLLALQHHPEKNLFEWAPGSNFDHSFLGSSYSQYIGDYFLQMARTSCQRFDSEDQLTPYLIYNYPVTYTQGQFDDKHFTQMYLFDQSTDDRVPQGHHGYFESLF